ncbi:ADP-forming succinate--CoA ligase subunit beta [Candidatus Atribacteria bacterium 1244-E10-H5-B2]|nr:MAG: ADP-forming succinate--CoA ligase subunit beta [Candidatus Atribacteria bacterium 1244-E10-H5-B2]
MKLYEYQVKEVFSKYGINIQKGKFAKTSQEAKQIAAAIGVPVVLKSQVLVGGRGKAGGVKIVDDLSDVEKVADKILKTEIKGHKPIGILVEKKLEIKQEFYLSIALDRKMKKTLVIFSSFGGMDIEEVSKKHPEKIAKLYVEELLGVQDFHINRLLPLVDNNREMFSKLKKIVKILHSIYKKYDSLIVEINPLVLTENGDLVALDGKMEIDNNASYRQKLLVDTDNKDKEDPIELMGKKAGFVVIKLKGNISIISNGAGLALSTLDLLHKHNMGVANILDLGGGATPEKVMQAIKVVIQDKDVKGILFNIFGGITRCDEIARGIAGALKSIPEGISVVCRLQGTNREEGISILKDVGLNAETDLEETVKNIVSTMNRG